MTFVPDRFSVGDKGHFLRWRVHYISCMHINLCYVRSTCPQAPPKNWAGPGRGYELIYYARSTQLRCGELWSACDIVFCVHPGWEGLFMSSIFRITNNSSSNKIQNVEIHFEIRKSTLKSRNPLWNPEIHAKSRNPLWNPEIHVKSRNPIWNPKSTWNPVDFEISYAEMHNGGPLVKRYKSWNCSVSWMLQPRW